MKKLLLILAVPLLMGAGCSNNKPASQDDIDEGIGAAKEIFEEIDQTYKVQGSCDTIDSASHCLDYIGSIWTEEQMALNCEGVGTYKKTTCPYSNNGGCRTGAGTVMEAVVWSYDYGGDPIIGEDAKYESMACDANPVASWVTADQLFLKE